MKKFFLIIVMPLLALSFNACDEIPGGENDDDAGDAIVKLVKKMSVDETSYMEFEYDDQGRVSKGMRVDEDGSSVITVEYGDNAITIKQGEQTSVYKLDNDGYATSCEYGYSGGESGITNYTYKNGRIDKSGNGDYWDTYTWENGNLSSCIKADYNVKYTYSDKKNKFNVNFFGPTDDYLFMFPFKGTMSENLPATRKSYYTDGNLMSDFSYSYEFDADGYVTKVKSVNNRGNTDDAQITYY